MLYKTCKTALIIVLIISFFTLLLPIALCETTCDNSLTVSIDCPTSGAIGESLQFYGSISGGSSPYTWLWLFDDGINSNEQNPAHSYDSTGYYSVLLRVTDDTGEMCYDTVTIHIKNINANANGPYTGDINEQIIFNGSVVGGDPPYSWSWDFGDGETSTEQNPIHSYEDEGQYSLVLTVNDDSGNSDSDSTSILVRPMVTWADDDYGNSTTGWGYDHFNSIQKAVEAVGNNGVVHVLNGIYYENVVIDKSIDLIGENKEITIIDGNNTGDVVSITADYINFSGFKIQNCDTLHAGILISSNYNSISDNLIVNNSFGAGIKLERTSHYTYVKENTIENNDIFENFYGIEIVMGSLNNTISGNVIDNSLGRGIDITGSKNNIENNIISNGPTGIYLGSYSQENIITGNTIDTHIGSGIQLVGSNSNTITGNTITDSNIGIHVYDDSYGNEISGNTFSGNYADINYGSSISLNIPTSDLFMIVVYLILGIGIIVAVILFYKKRRN